MQIIPPGDKQKIPMTKDTIIQFVCFITNLELDAFIAKWEPYAKKLLHKKEEPNLQQLVTASKNKFRYISQHEWPDRDFTFTFMNERKSEHFPEHNVRVVQIGGYVSHVSNKKHTEMEDEHRLIAFIGHNENDLDFFRQLPLYRHLLIHQAFYESCMYGYVLEFFVPEKDAGELLLQLKQRPGVEAGIYKDCLVPAT
ncbi:MAG: hypothetical protein ABI688_00760 [Bacteroidota bacterium]